MTPSHAPYASAHARARIVKILFIVGAVAALVSILAEGLSLAFPVTEGVEVEENIMGTVVALFMLLVGLLEFVIYVATVVVFLMWLYRVYNNLKAFGPWVRLESSAGWAVGSFFIPFANLVWPYRAVKEVWQKSWPPEDAILFAPSPPAIFPAWWTFWLLASFAGNISLRLTFNDEVPESAKTIASIVASALSIVAALFAYLVVDEIDKRQEETSAKVKLTTFQGPPPPPTSYPPMSDVVAPTS